ncbi:hypothetical protein HHL11_01990 [Ramlibacter sp. G-1-2-2]|uniref:Uncharacterized protein n=1 Tax=Ramlibacter agri TaxID=2728837 RepID=A0A848GYM8_9BURK|nr:hypothetical protein [Ramlibacter agri]NML42501.1 hypothetical protein [Ramlibacter agri]
MTENNLQIHFVEKNRSMKPVQPGNNTLWESGDWIVSETRAKALVGGRIHFHEKRGEPSYFGGTIQDYRVLPEEHPNAGKVVFTFLRAQESIGVSAGRDGWRNEQKMVGGTSEESASPDWEQGVDILADALARLPVLQRVDEEVRGVDDAPVLNAQKNARRRIILQTRAQALTVQDLWWQFVVSGTTSQEAYKPGSPSYHFHTAPASMYLVRRFAEVKKNAALGPAAFEAWVLSEFKSVQVPAKSGGTRGFRFVQSNADLVVRLYEHFRHLQDTDPLSAITAATAPTLQQFGELATPGSTLHLLDASLATSDKSSAMLDHLPFHRIGSKQLRNVLVSCGLAKNVLPLDSRWADFLTKQGIAVDKTRLGRDSYYLAVEDLARRALLKLHTAGQRLDIPNLAVLDAIVFLLVP